MERRFELRPLEALALAVACGQLAAWGWIATPGWTLGLRGLAVCGLAVLGLGMRAWRGRSAFAHGRWLLLAVLSFLVAAAGEPRIEQEELASGTTSLEGAWEPRSRDGLLGTLAGVGAGFEFKLHGAPPDRGEQIRIHALGSPKRAAAGPFSLAGKRARITVPADGWERVDPSPPSRLERGVLTARRLLGRRLASTERATGDARARGILRSLLLGNTAALPFETRDLFTRTGTRHLLAISGLHAGLVAVGLGVAASALFFPHRRRRRTRQVIAIGTAVCLGCWALVTGAAPPLVRAAITLSVARAFVCLPQETSSVGLLERNTDGRSLLALAFLVELLRDSQAVLSTSVQLSYGATAALIIFTRPWSRWLYRRVPRATTGWSLLGAGPIERTGRALVDRFAARFVDTMSASTVASLATLPVIWARFGESSWVSVPATPLALPFVAALLLGGSMSILGLPGATRLVELASAGLFALLQAFDQLTGTPTLLPPRSIVFVFAVCMGGLCLPWLQRRLRLAWCLGVCALLWPRTEVVEGLEIYALDVGAGTAIVVRSPEIECLVFDAGSRDRRQVWSAALQPLLAAWEVGEAHVVLTHDHYDHRAALPPLLSRVRCATYGGPLPDSLAAHLDGECTRWDGDGARLTVGDLELQLVQGSRKAGNEGSRSMIIEWSGRRVLLSGDAEAEGLSASLAVGALDGPFDLVLCPHHGSELRLLGHFLNQTQPARIWISGPGDAPVIPELRRRRIPVEATGDLGPLQLFLDPRLTP